MINKLAKYYFPNGCNYCSSEVELKKKINKEDSYIYSCTKCGAYVGCHRYKSDFNDKLSPLGMLADVELRKIKYDLTNMFNSLWVYGDINIIYNIFMVSCDGEPCVVISDKKSNQYQVKTYNGEIKTPTKFTKVSNRTKAYFWLNKYMGKDHYAFAIGWYDKKECLKATEYIKDKMYEFNIQYKNKFV